MLLDLERLRCEYRIIGALNGTLPQFPLQTTFNGLPLRLLPEEVAVLLKRGNVRQNKFKSRIAY
jgi:tRNA-splicing endonuclease subunit Sen34